MINKTIRIIEVESDDKRRKDIHFITKNLQSINYNVSGITIGCIEHLLVKEIEKSIKYVDAVLLVTSANSMPLWQAISKVVHQTITTNRQLVKYYGIKNSYGTMYSKCLEHPDVSPVMYVQGLFVISCESLRISFLKIVFPILQDLNTKLTLSRMLIIDNVQSKNVLNMLPYSDKVHVECNMSSSDIVDTLCLTSNSMSALLDYENSLGMMFQNAKYEVGNDLSKLVYTQPDLHIKDSIECIEECFRKYLPENIFVSFNGGKDCTVLLHLILGVLKKNYPNFKGKLFCVYIENENPFLELNKFIEECRQYYNLDIFKLNKSIKESLSLVLENKPHMKGVLMGTRRTDPFSAHLEQFQMTDRDWPQIMRVSPILDWHYSQIWDYLLSLKIPYCNLYDRGYTSLGSATNTIPNPFLLINNEHNTYLPAYKLLDASKERNGRKA